VSVERDLISKILHERDLTVVADSGVTPSFFQKFDHREAFKFILDHQRQYSQVPSEEAFARNYPTYRITEAPDTVQYYADTLAEHYSIYLLEDGLVQATDAFDEGDIEGAKTFLVQTLQKVNQEISKTRFSDLTENGPKRIERYMAYAKADGALKGISTGFSMIDQATGGMQPGQLFTFVGPPKAGKSTMMLLADMAAHRGFYRPLFIGFEMSNEEQEERHDAIRAGVSHKRLRDGTLKGEEMRELERMMRRMELMPAMIFSEDATSTSTLSGIAALVDKFKPDVVFVDGVYMMEDELGERKGSPQALTNLTRGFKTMAKNLHIPFAISTQVLEWKMDRKRGVTTGSIGYASSFAQDSDVLIGVEKTDDESVNKIKILDGRNVKRMEIFVQWNWETGDFVELEDPEGVAEDDPNETPKF
jgi:replicative DNA helicase